MGTRRPPAELELHHRAFVEAIIVRMRIQPRDRILDIGCGEGWAGRLFSQLVPEGIVVGIDASDEMVHNARAKSASHENAMFLWGEAELIPWQDAFFSQVLCVESFYYYEDPEKALREVFRVMSPGASVWILNLLSKENELSLRWIPKLSIPCHLLSVAEYRELFDRCGYQGFAHQTIPDRSPLSEELQREWVAGPAELNRFREIGALLMTAVKPR